ncbi:MAG: hypothetical protein ABSE84_11940 [Isosphaeraceae bacterium]
MDPHLRPACRKGTAAGTTMVELGRGPELQQWIGEMDSKVARAYACMGAAEVLQKK